MGRVVIAARLKPDSLESVRKILRAGPPFDLSATSLERHQVFLGSEHLVFLFEGPSAEQTVPGLLADLGVLGGAARIAEHLEGTPDVPGEVFSWERISETDGVSFEPQPGPGDSDGG